jgi:hypothetical protein
MKILKGNPDGNGTCLGHCGDTFRELVDIWEEMGLCEVEESPDCFCWVGECGDILLYDFPRVDDRHIPKFRHGLFGNTVPYHPNCYAWTFWARSPRLLMEARNIPLLSYDQREIESIFLGKIENPVQNANRTSKNWEDAEIQLFHCPIEKPGPDHYPFTKEEYLEKLRNSKFGLALAGYGPKCNREIELLGMGVVPIFTTEVDNTYHEPMTEGLHFLRVDYPSQVKPLIDSITESRWKEMHLAGQDWYNRNASPEGAYAVTRTIVDNLR